MKKRRMGYGRNLKRYFLTGILIVAPITISVYLLVWSVKILDQVLAPLFLAVFGHHIPGLGLIATILLFLLAGFLSSNIFGKHVLDIVEDMLLHIPVYNWLYRTIKQLTEVFSPTSKMQKQQYCGD